MQTQKQIGEFIDHLANNPMDGDQLVALTQISQLQRAVLAGDNKNWLAVMGAAFAGVAEAIGYDPITTLLTIQAITSGELD